MNRYRKEHQEPYSEESRRARSLAFPRTDSNYLALLFFPSDQLEVVLEVLEGARVSWIQIGINDEVCPPARTLEGLGSLEHLTCLQISARHALVEELLATLEYDCGLDWSFLDRLTWKLEERRVPFCIGLTLPSGGREWCELSFSQSGFWQSLDQLFGHTAVRSISSRSILATSKPYG